MEYELFTEKNINDILPLYINYYNEHENAEWTEITSYKRIHQMLSHEDSFGLILSDKNTVIGFAVGYFEQFDDCKTYNLIEIVVAAEYQNQGIGSSFMIEIEKRVKEMGAMSIILQAVNDDKHDRFYGRLGYKNVKNFVLKVKML